ncbi:hypothetical protein HYPSUDRAFT_1042041 [Hypholoma sublateritium FD-334 SS-4]|uniref:Uncharacterized protein n=1 Tax=Hypholoma sublateritium (strain FD-334 SS-4) TaxID=945553 RepID=A0A0D2KRJ0_HYPSF|nr:hypothetical protein HYPSUDRAFT_1042041 [Hypholoma sublateritium FD-334 SS-4]
MSLNMFPLLPTHPPYTVVVGTTLVTYVWNHISYTGLVSTILETNTGPKFLLTHTGGTKYVPRKDCSLAAAGAVMTAGPP